MAYQFEFDAANRILRCRWDGEVTDECLKDCYSALKKHAMLTKPRAGILDFSGVTAFRVASRTVQELARSAPSLADPSVPRIVVAPAPVVFGVARMFQVIGEETRPNLQVVRCADEAYTRLGVESPHFEKLQPIEPG